VDLVALEQRRDPAAVLRTRRDLQDQVTVAERLVVDLQGLLVVAEPLQGSHDAAPQPVVAAVLIQDACSLLPAQDLHRGDVDACRSQVCGDGGDLRSVGQQAYYVVDGPVLEVIDVDLRLVHVAAPGSRHPRPVRQQYPRVVLARRARLPGYHGAGQLGRIAGSLGTGCGGHHLPRVVFGRPGLELLPASCPAQRQLRQSRDRQGTHRCRARFMSTRAPKIGVPSSLSSPRARPLWHEAGVPSA
jgi:hypothetical protein